MVLSRTTSRLFNKAPSYTRPSANPAVGEAAGYGDPAQYRTGQMMRQFGQVPNTPQPPPVPKPATFVGPQNFMQSPVNMSGFQNQSMAPTMGLAGLMPGFAGAASQGYLAALGKGYSASQPLSQLNPMMTQSLPGQGQSARALNAITDTPQPQNSMQAAGIAANNPMMNQSVAGMSNGYYSPPSSVSQGRGYGLTIPMDLAGQQNRIASQNPMYQGMQGRFGAGSVMGQQAATIAAGDAASSGPNATMYDIPGSYGEMPAYNPLRPSPEVRFRSNANGDQVSFNSNNDPVLTRQQAALKNFVGDGQRGQNRKSAREATKSRLADSRFKLQVSQGLNPNSAKAKAMFPEQVAKMKGVSSNNPMAGGSSLAGTSLEAGSPVTPQSIADASTVMDGLAKGSPATGEPPDTFLSSIGATGSNEESIGSLHTGIESIVSAGVTPEPKDLRSLRAYLVALKRVKAGDQGALTPPVEVTGTPRASSMYEQLAGMPDDASDEQLAAWWTDSVGRVKSAYSPPAGGNPPNMNPPSTGVWSGAPFGR